MEATQQVLDTLDTQKEKDALQDKLNNLTKLWYSVTYKVSDGKERTTKAYETAHEYSEKSKKLSKWLETTEKKLKDAEPESCETSKLAEQQKEVNVSLY